MHIGSDSAVTAPKTHVALVAGAGITTALPQIKDILAQDPVARVLLFYGNRTTAEVEALEQLQALKDLHLNRLSLYFLFSGDPQEVELLNGELDGSKVRELAQQLFEPAGVDEFLLAGPNGSVVEFADTLKALGVAPVRLRGREDQPLSLSSLPKQPPGPSMQPAPIRLESAGQTDSAVDLTQVTVIMDGRRRSFPMARDGSTVLDAAEQAGLDLPFSCRAGVCSTCRTKVVKGSVDMLQNYALEPWEVEQGYVLACQSQPTCAELELDYDDK